MLGGMMIQSTVCGSIAIGPLPLPANYHWLATQNMS